MKKLMLLIVVLAVSAFYASSYAAKNAVTVDADLGSIVGVSATGDFGWPVNVSAGGGFDFSGDGGTGFVNAQYPVELTKTTLFDAGTLYGNFGAGYRFLSGDDNDSDHIGEAILGLVHQANNRWDLGAKTHLGGSSEGFEWAAYATIGYRFDL
ncbi:MAG: hypothetical protein HYY61_01140 [Deltaproteobacteria bacterium]|nr:hypothetical protein [Deltaproteobacteria bacterium]